MEQNETTSTVTSAPAQQNGYYNFVENPAEQYFSSGKWDSDRAFLKQSNLVTGYTNMDTLQAFSFNAGNKYTYPPEVLTDFEKHHPGCKLSGNLETVKDDEAS